MTGDQITQVIMAIIGLLGALISAFLIPYIKTKTTKEQRAFAQAVVVEAVRAAEQIFNKGGQGIEKYDFVVKYLKSEFKLNLSEKELKVLIESAVKEIKSLEQEMK